AGLASAVPTGAVERPGGRARGRHRRCGAGLAAGAGRTRDPPDHRRRPQRRPRGGHRLAARTSLQFADIADEPVVARPPTSGLLRDAWLAMERRTEPPVIAGEAATPDEAYELVAAEIGRAHV